MHERDAWSHLVSLPRGRIGKNRIIEIEDEIPSRAMGHGDTVVSHWLPDLKWESW